MHRKISRESLVSKKFCVNVHYFIDLAQKVACKTNSHLSHMNSRLRSGQFLGVLGKQHFQLWLEPVAEVVKVGVIQQLVAGHASTWVHDQTILGGGGAKLKLQ